jgi:hypothetical protein
MARPITDTPVLRGKDALRFMVAMADVKPISKKEKERIEKSYQWFKKRANFPL